MKLVSSLKVICGTPCWRTRRFISPRLAMLGEALWRECKSPSGICGYLHDLPKGRRPDPSAVPWPVGLLPVMDKRTTHIDALRARGPAQPWPHPVPPGPRSGWFLEGAARPAKAASVCHRAGLALPNTGFLGVSRGWLCFLRSVLVLPFAVPSTPQFQAPCLRSQPTHCQAPLLSLILNMCLSFRFKKSFLII